MKADPRMNEIFLGLPMPNSFATWLRMRLPYQALRETMLGKRWFQKELLAAGMVDEIAEPDQVVPKAIEIGTREGAKVGGGSWGAIKVRQYVRLQLTNRTACTTRSLTLRAASARSGVRSWRPTPSGRAWSARVLPPSSLRRRNSKRAASMGCSGVQVRLQQLSTNEMSAQCVKSIRDSSMNCLQQSSPKHRCSSGAGSASTQHRSLSVSSSPLFKTHIQ